MLARAHLQVSSARPTFHWTTVRRGLKEQKPMNGRVVLNSSKDTLNVSAGPRLRFSSQMNSKAVQTAIISQIVHGISESEYKCHSPCCCASLRPAQSLSSLNRPSGVCAVVETSRYVLPRRITGILGKRDSKIMIVDRRKVASRVDYKPVQTHG